MTPDVHINRFGGNPQNASAKQMMLNHRLVLSRRKSVNDSIDSNLCSLKYATVEQVAKEAIALGKDSLIAKIDIKAAYRLIPVAPKDRLYLGMKWEDKSLC